MSINRNIIFLDSLQFLKGSLDYLAGNLEDTDFKHLMSEFSKDQLELLRKRDAYPYDWVDSYKKILYPRLPPKESFCSSINGGKRGEGDGRISYSKYLHLELAWKESGFEKLKDFHNHYLKKRCIIISRCI